jgi:hypothetical protein
MPHRIVPLALDLADTARKHDTDVQDMTQRTSLLALNALIESSHAGVAGKGFAIIAREVKEVSRSVSELADRFRTEVERKTSDIERIGKQVLNDMNDLRGNRLADLALNMIDITDRNLYERSCDVRWWASESAVIDCGREAAQGQASTLAALASSRLGVILDAYTVYLDIWLCSTSGKVLATGRPEKFRAAPGAMVGDRAWFTSALKCVNGEYTVDEIRPCPELDNKRVAVYAAPVRDPRTNSVVGVLSVFFNWQVQSQIIVDGVRLLPQEKSRSRCLMINNKGVVIAASDSLGVGAEVLTLKNEGKTMGYYRDANTLALVAFAKTPGYETYQGQGWFGVIIQKDS